MGGKPGAPSIPSDATMAEGSKEHFSDGITILGKLIWPADVTPSIIEIELEDSSGLVVADTKSLPNNEFQFTEIPIVENITNSYLTYYISINDAPGLDIVRQQFNPTTNNFTGGLHFHSIASSARLAFAKLRSGHQCRQHEEGTAERSTGCIRQGDGRAAQRRNQKGGCRPRARAQGRARFLRCESGTGPRLREGRTSR